MYSGVVTHSYDVRFLGCESVAPLTATTDQRVPTHVVKTSTLGSAEAKGSDLAMTTDSQPTATELLSRLNESITPNELGPLVLAAMQLGDADVTEAMLRAAVRILPLSDVPITVTPMPRAGEGN